MMEHGQPRLIDSLIGAASELSRDRVHALHKYLEQRMTIDQLKTIIQGDPELQTFTLEDIAKSYGVSERSLQRYIASGALRATRFGRKYQVTVSALREFLQQRRHNPAEKRGRTRRPGRRS